MRPSVEFAVLCDDYRLELGKKVSLIGLYGNHILLSSNDLPTMIWKICYFQRWSGVGDPLEIQIELVPPSGKANQPPLQIFLVKPQHPEDVRQVGVSMQPLPILEHGQYHLKTYALPEHELLHDFAFVIKPNPEIESAEQLPLELIPRQRSR